MRIVLSSFFVLFFVSSYSQHLVMRGDYPDPSVVKIGDTYWASATTSNWGPAYPILKSKDLVNWETESHVFMKLPDWADYYFWAPEITYENGKVYVYYAAHKKGGNLCIAVASADRPEGPYTDHGPLMCETVGSIDAYPMRDEKGKLHMIWKEDANSVNKPTPIWIMEMNEARTKLIGERKELFRNDVPWEANLVEGVSMVRNGGYFYAFYAAAGCCGATCTYGVGIARSKSLHGPWEKYAKNPVMTHSDKWKCPGHGTPVEKGGKHYFLYHAYDKEGSIYSGRQGLLIEYRFTADGWIEFVNDADRLAAVPIVNTDDTFKRDMLSASWQWSVFKKPEYHIKRGALYLSGDPTGTGAMLGHKTLTENYNASAHILLRKSNAAPGLAIVGDEANMITAIHSADSIRIIQVKEGKQSVLASKYYRKRGRLVLHVSVEKGNQIRFYYGRRQGQWLELHSEAIDGTYLPPWDRAIRVGLIAKGASGTKAVFDEFMLNSR